MTVRILPVRVGVPFQSFQVDLDGVPYNFEIRWNERARAWVMALRDAQGVVLRQGIRLCLGTPLLPPQRPATFPAGELLLVEDEGNGIDPGENELGADARVRLVYLEAADVADALNG